MRYIRRMTTDTEYKSGDLARRFNVHANTVRDWSDRYSDLLSPRATAAKRTYTLDDALVLSTVASMRDVGLTFEAIRDALDNGQRVDAIPDAPTPEESAARESMALVPLPELERALDNVQQLTGELERARQALAQSESNREALQERVIDLTGQLAAAKARVDVIERERPTARYWLTVLAGAVVVVALVVYLLMRV